MNKVDEINSYYKVFDKRLEDHQRLGWESREAHVKRFEMLLKNVDLQDKKILDVGCGLGNLYGYIIDKGINVDYTGVDILDSMVESASCKYSSGRFLCADVFKDNVFENGEFDVVYSSGIFNLNLGNNIVFIKDAFKKFFYLSKHIICFNLLNISSHDREDRYFYMKPEEAVSLVKECAEGKINVSFFESYLENDFTIICEK